VQRPVVVGKRSRRTFPATVGQTKTSLLMRSAATPASGQSPLIAFKLYVAGASPLIVGARVSTRGLLRALPDAISICDCSTASRTSETSRIESISSLLSNSVIASPQTNGVGKNKTPQRLVADAAFGSRVATLISAT